MMVLLFIATACTMHTAVAQDWPMVNGNKERTSYVDNTQFQPPLRVTGPGALNSANINPFAFYDGVLYGARSGEPNYTVAVDAATGNVLWSFEMPGTRAAMNHVPAVSEDLVLCGAQNCKSLYALDRHSGVEQWSLPVVSLSARHTLIDGDRAYVMTDTLFCIELSTGTVLWTYDIATTGAGTPSVDDKAVYANVGRFLFAVDKVNGSELWRVASKDRSYAQVIAGSDTLYASNQKAVRAINRDDGSIIWETDLPEINVVAELVVGRMALAPDLICHAAWSDTTGVAALIALERSTGAVRWTHQFTGEGMYTPVIVGDYVYAAEWDKDILWALRMSDGSAVWDMQLDQVTDPPIFADGKLYVGSGPAVVALESTPSAVGDVLPQRSDLTMTVAPNPTTDQLRIRLSLAQRAPVRISLHDIQGREVYQLFSSVMDAGTRTFSCSLAALASHALPPGMYLLQARTPKQVVSRKIVVPGK
jgi:outer membrane protein assembly factor BamB